MGVRLRLVLKSWLGLALLAACQFPEPVALPPSPSLRSSPVPSASGGPPSAKPDPDYVRLADFTRGLCKNGNDFRLDPAWTEARAQVLFGLWQEGEMRIAAGQLHFIQLQGAWTQPYFSFSASPGVRIRHMARSALPTKCMSVEALYHQPIGTYDKPWQYLVIEADTAGHYSLTREEGAPLDRPDTPEVVAPTSSPEPDVIYLGGQGIEVTTLNGYVFDEEGQPVANARVQVQSLEPELPYLGDTVTDLQGFYQLRRVHVGRLLRLRVNKPGYAERLRTEVLTVHLEKTVNRISFGIGPELPPSPWANSGHDASAVYAMSELPEVVATQPGRFASGIRPDTSFSLKFSEPVDPACVEGNFGIWAATDERLSVGKSLDGVGSLTFLAPAGEAMPDLRREASLIWDASDFDIAWNQDFREVMFSFKPGRQLPSDRAKDRVPDYLLALSGVGDGRIRDLSGKACDAAQRGCFRLVERFERWLRFAIQADTTGPEILAISAQDGQRGSDRVVLGFSEPMLLETRSGIIAGGSGTRFGDTHVHDYGSPDQSPLNPDNYELSVQPLGNADPSVSSDFVPLTSLGVKVEHEVAMGRWNLRFVLPATAFDPGDRIVLRIRDTVTDPAGNPLAPGQRVQMVTVND